MSDVIRITCTADKHQGREVHVAAFAPNDPQPGWHQVVKNGPRNVDAGRTLWGDSPQRHGADHATARDVWRLECRKCHRPVSLRDEQLEKALDGFRELGVNPVPLSAVAATLGRSQ